MSSTHRKKLLVITSTYPRWKNDPEPGFVHELAKRLAGDFEVAVICPHAPGALRYETLDSVRVLRYKYAPTRLQLLVSDGGILANLRRSKWKWLLLPGFFLAQSLALVATVWRWRPDVIHAHWVIPQGITAALVRSLLPVNPKLIITLHGADLYALTGRILSRLRVAAVRGADVVAVVSSPMRDELSRQLGEDRRLKVLPMGVDLSERFVVPTGTPRSLDEILFVGRLVEKKGLVHLVAAMPLILKIRPNAKLVVVGGGPQGELVRSQVQELGLGSSVQFLGGLPQSALSDLYQRAAVTVAPFVQASDGDQEGLGLVVIEAMGCGCPVVVGDVPAVHHALPVGGEDTVMVMPSDLPALAAAICSMMDVTERSGAAGERRRAAAVAHFDWSQRAGDYAKVIREMAAGK